MNDDLEALELQLITARLRKAIDTIEAKGTVPKQGTSSLVAVSMYDLTRILDALEKAQNEADILAVVNA